MSANARLTEREFLECCERELQLRGTDASILAQRMYDALAHCGAFRISYVTHDTRHVAQFWNGDDEICRAVVGTGEYDGRTYSGIWICKRRNFPTDNWPTTRSQDFQRRFGFEARAGSTIIEWCVENRDRINELLRWFVAQAVGVEQAAAIAISIETEISPASTEGARHFGEFTGLRLGDTFASRAELAAANVHKPLVAGISGSQSEGADSIVMSGGYEDDEDYGDTVVYTGHGGNDPNTGRQVEHQEWSRGNQALRINQIVGLPVRVIRGSGLDSPYAPANGYRYDGLYRVDDSWMETGRSGFRVCRFRLVRGESPTDEVVEQSDTPRRLQTTVQRIIRNTTVAQDVKRLHKCCCQACGTTVITPAGPYAEAAHIRPLGTPHDGPDVAENILCLCPTCHVLFDNGGFLLYDDLVIQSITAPELHGRQLGSVPAHRIDFSYIAYHRDRYGQAD